MNMVIVVGVVFRNCWILSFLDTLLTVVASYFLHFHTSRVESRRPLHPPSSSHLHHLPTRISQLVIIILEYVPVLRSTYE